MPGSDPISFSDADHAYAADRYPSSSSYPLRAHSADYETDADDVAWPFAGRSRTRACTSTSASRTRRHAAHLDAGRMSSCSPRRRPPVRPGTSTVGPPESVTAGARQGSVEFGPRRSCPTRPTRVSSSGPRRGLGEPARYPSRPRRVRFAISRTRCPLRGLPLLAPPSPACSWPPVDRGPSPCHRKRLRNRRRGRRSPHRSPRRPPTPAFACGSRRSRRCRPERPSASSHGGHHARRPRPSPAAPCWPSSGTARAADRRAQITPAGWPDRRRGAKAGLLSGARDFTGGGMPPGSVTARLEILADGRQFDLVGDPNRIMSASRPRASRSGTQRRSAVS